MKMVIDNTRLNERLVTAQHMAFKVIILFRILAGLRKRKLASQGSRS